MKLSQLSQKSEDLLGKMVKKRNKREIRNIGNNLHQEIITSEDLKRKEQTLETL